MLARSNPTSTRWASLQVIKSAGILCRQVGPSFQSVRWDEGKRGIRCADRQTPKTIAEDVLRPPGAAVSCADLNRTLSFDFAGMRRRIGERANAPTMVGNGSRPAVLAIALACRLTLTTSQTATRWPSTKASAAIDRIAKADPGKFLFEGFLFKVKAASG